MKVTQLAGEPLRFHVESRTRSVDHLVDFTSGRGECSCEHFTLTILIQIRDKVPGVRECWHIGAARNFAVRKLKDAFCRGFRKSEEKNYVATKLFEWAVQSSRKKAVGKGTKTKGAVGQGLPSPGAKTYVLREYDAEGRPEPF